MIMSMMLGYLYVQCMGLEKRMPKGTDDARHNLFVKAKRDLEVLPPNHGA